MSDTAIGGACRVCGNFTVSDPCHQCGAAATPWTAGDPWIGEWHHTEHGPRVDWALIQGMTPEAARRVVQDAADKQAQDMAERYRKGSK